ncbi:hypothetical protein BASA60_001196 [Batrachochytrium salamandrivorans]|nr:hypothetical protein BASA60_010849 [Batrachochytrium salamandrivorans]KAH6583883.1 hypothetical protein BASA60_001196 [Batrachochytrium salamandrivorans]
MSACPSSPVSLDCLLIATNQGRLRFVRHWQRPYLQHDPAVTTAATIVPESMHSTSQQPMVVHERQSPVSASEDSNSLSSSSKHRMGVACPSTLKADTLFEQALIHECAKQPSKSDHGSFFVGNSLVVFRRFASLNFMVTSAQSENLYAMLAFIQIFVEMLSKYFGSFSEYHIIFHIEKIHLVLDEMVCSGFLVETNKDLILPMFAQLERHVASSI